MSDSIISISLIDDKFKTSNSFSELISNIEKTQIILKPKTFKDLYNKIFPDSKFDENQKIYGFLPDGHKIELNDDEYKNNSSKISIYLGYKQKGSNPIPHEVTIEKKTLDRLNSIEIPTDRTVVDSHVKDIGGLTTEISGKIGEVQNNLFDSFIDEFDKSLNENLNESLKDIVLKVSTKNIQKVENLRNSVQIFSKKFIQRANSCIDMSKQNSQEMQKVKKILEKKRSQIFDNKVIEDEQIFEFCDNSISVEETMPNFELKNIRIKNNSNSKDYKSDILVWLKEQKSNEDLNFDQEGIKNEFPFVKGQCYPNHKEIDDLTLKLRINEPKEQEYKMLLSIKDIQTQKIISKNTLEVTVKMKPEKKPEPIDVEKIWNNLKELEFFDLISDNKEEINKKIQDENGNVSQIKIWVKQEIENKKQNKIKEILEKYQEEFNKTTVKGDESKIKEIILEKKFNEIDIKKWIENNTEKAPDPIPKPEPKPEPKSEPKPEPKPEPEPEPRQDQGDQRAEEIYSILDEEFVVSNFMEKDEVISKIRDLNYDIEQCKTWIEDQI